MCLKCKYAELGLGFTKDDYKKVCDALEIGNNGSYYRFNKSVPVRYIPRITDIDFYRRIIRQLETYRITQTVNKSSVLKVLHGT